MKNFNQLYTLLTDLYNNDGLTLKHGEPIVYKSGYQVARDNGAITADAREAVQAVMAANGNAGIWFSNGKYYIDNSFRVSTKRDAMRIAKEEKQISILQWKGMKLIYT